MTHLFLGQVLKLPNHRNFNRLLIPNNPAGIFNFSAVEDNAMSEGAECYKASGPYPFGHWILTM